MSSARVLGNEPLASGRQYPERADETPRWHDKLALQLYRRLLFPLASRWTSRPGALESFSREVMLHAPSLENASDEELGERSKQLRLHLRRHGFERSCVAQCFALISEAAFRTVGKRHYPCQFMTGWALVQGRLVEMATGEGKTFAAALPAAVAAWAGLPVHVITVNDYLAERDAMLLQPLYSYLGLDVAAINHEMDGAQRRAAYRQHVAYCSNQELAFDYLRDRAVSTTQPGGLHRALTELLGGKPTVDSELVLRGLVFGIVDEADSVLIDEARTPLILSRRVQSSGERRDYERALEVARTMVVDRDFRIDVRYGRVHLEVSGREKLAALPGREGLWASARASAELVTQALSALKLHHADQHYVVLEGKVMIVDEPTGRSMADRSWERGLQQMIEVKEGCRMSERHETIARLTYQRLFRRYLRLAGMTGTAAEVAGEVKAIYRPGFARVPLHRALRRSRWPDLAFASRAQKREAVADAVELVACRGGRPVLIGTRSVRASEQISELLTQRGIGHALLNAKQDEQEAEVIAQAGQPGRITVATNMAGRGTDIVLGPGVAERGGLHVILTEFHESRRIDRQLFGRCARQGDPGSCQAIVALDDEIFRVHAPWSSRLAVAAAGRLSGIAGWTLMPLLWLAQASAEQRNAFLRAQTLKLDEQQHKTLAFSGSGE